MAWGGYRPMSGQQQQYWEPAPTTAAFPQQGRGGGGSPSSSLQRAGGSMQQQQPAIASMRNVSGGYLASQTDNYLCRFSTLPPQSQPPSPMQYSQPAQQLSPQPSSMRANSGQVGCFLYPPQAMPAASPVASSYAPVPGRQGGGTASSPRAVALTYDSDADPDGTGSAQPSMWKTITSGVMQSAQVLEQRVSDAMGHRSSTGGYRDGEQYSKGSRGGYGDEGGAPRHLKLIGALVCVIIFAGIVFAVVMLIITLLNRVRVPVRPPLRPGEIPPCEGVTPCPVAWSTSQGGYYCPAINGCRPWDQSPFPLCTSQCVIGDPPQKFYPGQEPGSGPSPAPVPGGGGVPVPGGGTPGGGGSLQPKQLTAAGFYDLRVLKAGRLLGCAAPIGLFPGQPKYGCAGPYATAQTCDAVAYPVKDTQYVAAVHAGCEPGRGTYGYAYDDGVGLKQCAPVTKYEWILCPEGNEGPIRWRAEPGSFQDSTKRFRVHNKCGQPIWVQQATPEFLLPGEATIRRIDPGQWYDYSIPNKGLPSTRFLPKTGCDATGNACDVQSMPPCPPQGCDLPVDTKFEASWGCLYALGTAQDKINCALTGQGNPSTYQDWWDGSAVDGWTLPFTVLVDDSGHGLTPFETTGSSPVCTNVVCNKLDASKLCPTEEYLTPEA